MRLPQIGGQVITELDDLIELANEYEPTSYLEIGAREGIALRYFVERVPSITNVTVVDLPGADWGKANSDIQLRDNLASLPVVSNVLLGDSTDPEIVRQVNERRYSIVFIDGDHSYDGVVSDLNNYRACADDLVCLHDINHPPDSRAYGPSRLWNELCAESDDGLIELIANDSRKGIGVIVV